MSDYWDQVAKQVEAKKARLMASGLLECARCGGEYYKGASCARCSLIGKVKCVTCGEDMVIGGGRKRCQDCVGERSETRSASFKQKLRNASDMKATGDSRI